MQANVPFWDIRTGHMNDEKFVKLADAMGQLADADLFIDDKPGQSILEIRTKARRLALEQGVDFIIVDYLQLMHGTHRDNRVLEVQEISQGLKNLARELKVPVLHFLSFLELLNKEIHVGLSFLTLENLVLLSKMLMLLCLLIEKRLITLIQRKRVWGSFLLQSIEMDQQVSVDLSFCKGNCKF
jgi:hypothetical protein